MGRKTTYVTGLTDVYSRNTALTNNGAKEPLGSIRAENNATYKYVQFSGTTAIAAGDVLCYVAYASDGNNYIVDKANTSHGAGIAMAAVASGTVQFGWIQIAGLATCANAFEDAPALGAAMTTNGATAGTIGVIDALGEAQHAICYDATAKKLIAQFPY